MLTLVKKKRRGGGGIIFIYLVWIKIISYFFQINLYSNDYLISFVAVVVVKRDNVNNRGDMSKNKN